MPLVYTPGAPKCHISNYFSEPSLRNWPIVQIFNNFDKMSAISKLFFVNFENFLDKYDYK